MILTEFAAIYINILLSLELTSIEVIGDNIILSRYKTNQHISLYKYDTVWWMMLKPPAHCTFFRWSKDNSWMRKPAHEICIPPSKNACPSSPWLLWTFQKEWLLEPNANYRQQYWILFLQWLEWMQLRSANFQQSNASSLPLYVDGVLCQTNNSIVIIF